MTKAPSGLMRGAPAVIATKPESIPLFTPLVSNFFSSILRETTITSTPAAGPMVVDTFRAAPSVRGFSELFFDRTAMSQSDW